VKLRLTTLLLTMSVLMAGAADHPRPASAGAREVVLKEAWSLQAAAKVEAGGQEISTPGFVAKGWLPTTVPATVMAALVRNGVHKDPFFDRNLEAIQAGVVVPHGVHL